MNIDTDHQLAEQAVQDSINELQHCLAKQANAITRDDIVMHHRFEDGLYIRVMELPADTIGVGNKHKTNHVFALLEGKCTMVSVDGIIELEAPFVSFGGKGIQRVCFSDTKCVMMNIHKTNTTDLHELEKELVEPSNLLEAQT